MTTETAPAADGSGSDRVDLITRAVRAVPGVVDLHAGVLGEVATYLPGRRVGGLRLREPGCEVHLVLASGAAVDATTDAVRAAVRAVVATGPIEVTVQDVVAATAVSGAGDPA